MLRIFIILAWILTVCFSMALPRKQSSESSIKPVSIPPLLPISIGASDKSTSPSNELIVYGKPNSKPGQPASEESLILARSEYEVSGEVYDHILNRLQQQQNALQRQQDRLRMLRSQADRLAPLNRLTLPSADDMADNSLTVFWDPRYPLSIVLSFQPRQLWAMVKKMYPTVGGVHGSYGCVPGGGGWWSKMWNRLFKNRSPSCRGVPRINSLLVSQIRPVPLFADEFGEISATTSTSTSITTTSSTVAASYNSLTVNRRHKKGHDRVKARRFQLKISIWRRRAEWIRTAAYPAVDLLKSDNDQVELIVPFASGDWGAVNKDDLWMLRMALSMEGVEAREGLPLYQFKFHPVLPPSNSPQ